MKSMMIASRQKVGPIGKDMDLENARWQAVVDRNAGFDGAFIYAVMSTGIFCRPSCGARQALRRNVTFFATPAEAAEAGFRACKRCRPDGPSAGEAAAALVERACALMAEAESSPDLGTLAKHLGLSPFQLHRLFKATTGITPKAYASAERARRLRREIVDGTAITPAIYGAGYGSSSRFYETANARLGMTPRTYRNGAVGISMRFAVGECSLGHILVAASERGITAVEFGDDAETLLDALQTRFPHAKLIGADPAFETLVATVITRIETPRRAVDLPLDIRGTAFQEQVWQALRAIPAGKTATYAEVATMIGHPAATRAVANACGQNRVAVLIPCHRVIRMEGSAGGYRWGIDRKEALLAREQGMR